MANRSTLKRLIAAGLLFAGFAGSLGVRAFGQSSPSTAQTAAASEPWQREFESVCSTTQKALSFSQEELAALIQRCDALMPQIEKLEGTQKKVYLGRLRGCRGVYDFVLESKKNEEK